VSTGVGRYRLDNVVSATSVKRCSGTAGMSITTTCIAQMCVKGAKWNVTRYTFPPQSEKISEYATTGDVKTGMRRLVANSGSTSTFPSVSRRISFLSHFNFAFWNLFYIPFYILIYIPFYILIYILNK
jgi:hypothetical protein